MDTTNYLYAAYIIFWMIPTAYLFLLFRKTNDIETKLTRALEKLEREKTS